MGANGRPQPTSWNAVEPHDISGGLGGAAGGQPSGRKPPLLVQVGRQNSDKSQSNFPPTSPYAHVSSDPSSPRLVKELRERLRKLERAHMAVQAENRQLKGTVTKLEGALARMEAERSGQPASTPRGAAADGVTDDLKPITDLLSSQVRRSASVVGGSKLVTEAKHFVFGSAKEFLGGLVGLTGGAMLRRSIEEECRENEGGRWWAEFEYVAYMSAEENPPHLPSTQKFLHKKSCTGHEIIRDQGHRGWSLATFCQAEEATRAQLSEAEVAALRLYSGPLYEALNGALREQRVADWATTISCCYSGTLKLSSLSKPARVYRGVRETDMQLPKRFLEPMQSSSGFAGGVERGFMSTTRSPEVALDYSGGQDTPGSIIIADFEMGSRGASIQFLSQYPHEDELLFPPLTTLSTRKVVRRGAKRLVMVSVEISTSVPDTAEIHTASDVPGTAAARHWLARQLSLASEAELASLSSCDLSGRSCTGAGAAHLGMLLGRSQYAIPSLRCCNLHHTQLEDLDVSALLEGVARSLTLRELRLSNNKLTVACVPALASALKQSKSLRALHLENTAIGTDGARQLGRALIAAAKGGACRLETITLHSCELPIRQLLGLDRDLQNLDLAGRSLVAGDGVLVAALLSLNGTLRSLRLSDNRIADAAEDLAECLSLGGAKQLCSLHLDANNVSDKGKRALKQATVGRKIQLVLD